MNALRNLVLAAVVAAASACGESAQTAADIGGAGAADTGTAAGLDAGGVAGSDAGSAGTPVAISFAATCPAIDPCGGSPLGNWTYTEACCDDPFGAAKSACAGVTVESPSGTVKGGMQFTGVSVTRDITVQLAGTLKVPASCAVAGCGTIQTALKQYYDSVTCTAAASGCSCQVSDTNRIADVATYTVSGGTLTATAGNTSTYSFCQTGSSLAYRETTSGSYDRIRYTLGKQ